MGRRAGRWWAPLAMLLLFGCGGSPDGPGTGAIAVRATWPGDAQPAARVVADAPAGVTTVRVIVEGAGISPSISQDFPAAAGQGTVSGVPAGTNRIVRLHGLAGGAVIYEGAVTGITVTAGQTSNAGTVVMQPVAGSPGVVVTPAAVAVAEPAGSAIFSVVLAAQPNGTVAVDVVSAEPATVLVAAGGGAAAASTSLTFGSGDWDTPQTVTVSAVDNTVVDGTRTVTVVVDVDAAATLDTTGYAGLSPGAVADVTVTVTDDDSVGPVFYTIGGTITGLEGSGAVLQLNGASDLPLDSGPGNFVIGSIADGNTYTVTVLTQPSTPNQFCTVTNGSGTVNGSDVSNISIDCVTVTTGGLWDQMQWNVGSWQ